MNAVTRSLLLEARRLPADPTLLACAIGAALFAVAMALALAGQPRSVMSANAFGATALLDVAFVAAAFGAIRSATRFARGLCARDALANGARAAWSASTVAAGLGGGLLGLLTAALLSPVAVLAGGVAVPASLWPPALLVGIGAGLWGGCVGSIARVPLAVLLIVAATLSPALLLADAMPSVATHLPLGTALAATGHPLAAGDAAVGWLALAWLGLALVASALSTRLRPLL